MSGGTAIEVTQSSRVFTLSWASYVVYSVLNESFANPSDHTEVYEGGLFRVYTKSHFIDYLSRATFATNEYPGPMQHYEVCCVDHVFQVISTSAPHVERTCGESDPGKKQTFRM